jgi:hypothetical protein
MKFFIENNRILVGVVVFASVAVFGATHSLAAESKPQDIVVDAINQKIRIDEPCGQLIITKSAAKCVVEVNSRIEGDVTVDADSCTIEFLKGASFGVSQTWWSWLWSKSNTGITFYIRGSNVRFTVAKDTRKGIEGRVFVSGKNVNIESGIGGQATITGDNCVVGGGVGGTITVAGDDCSIQGGIGGAAHIEGKRCTIAGGVGGTATVAGEDCTIKGGIGGVARIEGDRCTINGGISGSLTVTGKEAKIHGSVCGSAKIRKDTKISGDVVGKKTIIA